MEKIIHFASRSSSSIRSRSSRFIWKNIEHNTNAGTYNMLVQCHSMAPMADGGANSVSISGHRQTSVICFIWSFLYET